MKKEKLRDYPVGSDPELQPEEKETCLTFPNDLDKGRIHTEVPTVIKWVLSVDESEVENLRILEGEVVSITAKIPKGIIKLQGSSRKSNTHSQMVAYGPHK